MSALTGGCLCGAVRYALARPPKDIATCHCTMCRRAGGGPFQIYGDVLAEDLTWTQGSPRLARTSAHAERLFCAACGTPLIFRYAGEARWGLAIPSLDEPEGYAPTLHEGVEGRLPWLHLDDGLPERRTEDDPEFQAAIARSSG